MGHSEFKEGLAYPGSFGYVSCIVNAVYTMIANVIVTKTIVDSIVNLYRINSIPADTKPFVNPSNK